jgi:hypothetical protein
MFRENLRGHLRFLAKHARPGKAEQARRLLRLACLFRGAIFPGARGAMYREAAAWLGSGDVVALLERTA